MSSETIIERPIVAMPEFAGILRDSETFATDEVDSTSNRLNGWFDRLMLQSGYSLIYSGYREGYGAVLAAATEAERPTPPE